MGKGLIKKLTILLVLFIFNGIFFLNEVTADIIKLKSGREISGRIKEINDKDIVLDMAGGSMWFGRDQVESINSLSIEEAQARLSTEDAFIFKEKNKAISSSAQEGINFVSKTRKLEFKNIPEIEITDKDKIKAYLKEQIEKYYSKDKLETRGKLLTKLGIISNARDYVDKVYELLGEQVAGYYNTDDKKIYINDKVLGEILPGVPSMTIMHEQVHALQDQYYDLKRIEDSILLNNEDEGLAAKSVIEGEATVLMYDAFFRSFRAFGMPEVSKEGFDLRSFVIDSMLAYSKRFKTNQGQPAIFVEDLLFPYVWGGSFIQHLVNTKGWEAVDSIYIDMPASSEQIMHPEKYYIARDAPKKINFPNVSSILGASWTRLSADTLGEFGFYLIGKVFLDELSTKLMSEGWAGDYFEFYEEPNSKNTLLISLSKWDTEKDADDFLNFYKKIIEKKYKQITLIKEDLNSYQWKTGQDNVYISKSKDSVVIIEGIPDNLLNALIEVFII